MPKTKKQKREEAVARNVKSEVYPCGHKHVPGNQHFCPVYTYYKPEKGLY